MSVAILAGLALSLAGSPALEGPKGYLATPKSGHGRGVLVLHPWWGLNGDVRSLCDRLAASGFVAFAPDLFEGKTTTTPSAAEALVQAYEPKHLELKAKIAQSAKYLGGLTHNRKIAVVGLSFGAYYALHASNAEPERVKAVVDFYGTGQDDFTKSKASYLGHFAEKDDFEPKKNVDGLKKLLHDAHRPSTIYTYPKTGHWFFEPSVKPAYNRAASDLAWKRTLSFLRAELR